MANRSQQGSAVTQMVIVGLGLAASMVFFIGLFIGAETDPGPSVSARAATPFTIDRNDDEIFPSLVVVVTETDELVAIDTANGKRRDLVTPTSDSGAPTDQGFGGITMPNGSRIVYYERQSETGSTIWRVSTAGGPAQRVTNGRDPAVSPDGRQLAALVGNQLVITDLADASTIRRAGPPGTTLARPAWAPTGRALVVEVLNNNQIRLVTTRLTGGDTDQQNEPEAEPASQPTPVALSAFTPLASPPAGDSDAITRLARPTWRASDSAIVGIGARGGATYGVVVDPDTGTQTSFALEGPADNSDYDSTGTYFGYVLDQGVARWKGAGETGRLGEGIVRLVW